MGPLAPSCGLIVGYGALGPSPAATQAGRGSKSFPLLGLVHTMVEMWVGQRWAGAVWSFVYALCCPGSCSVAPIPHNTLGGVQATQISGRYRANKTATPALASQKLGMHCIVNKGPEENPNLWNGYCTTSYIAEYDPSAYGCSLCCHFPYLKSCISVMFYGARWY